MAETDKVIECVCGAIIEAPDEDSVVSKAQEHAQETHDMSLSRDQALAMSRPA